MGPLDVFGGRDNLELMCNATRFHKEAHNRVSFSVDTYLIRLEVSTRKSVATKYYLDIFDGVSGSRIGYSYTTSPNFVQDRFERYTGYALSF